MSKHILGLVRLDASAAVLAASALLASTLLVGVGSFARPAEAQVYLPCAPKCTVDPCAINPDRCKDKGGPIG